MKNLRLLLLPAALATLPLAAFSDPWKDESGHGKGRRHAEFKEEYWDGHCKVERKLEKNGDYKEERKCKGAPQVYYPQPAPVVVVPAPLPPITEPGITVHGTVRIK